MKREGIWDRLVVRLLEFFLAPYSVFRRVLKQVLALVVVVYLLTLVFVYYQGLDWVSGVYAAVNVLTTVGLYSPDIHTMPEAEKAILTVLMVAEIVIYASIAQNVILTLTNRQVWLDARARWRGRHMRGHVVVIGNSLAILSAVARLERSGVDYVVLTANREVYGRVKEGKAILGDPKDEKNLIDAGVKEASSAIIAADEDSETLLIALKVQKLNPPLTVVASVKDPSMADLLRTAGVDVVIPLEDVMGRILATASITRQFVGFMLTERREDFSMGVVTLKRDLRLGDLPEGVVPIAVLEDRRLNPYFTRETVVKKGSTVFLLGEPGKLNEVLKELGEQAK